MPLEFHHASLWKFFLGITLVIGVLLASLFYLVTENPELLSFDFSGLESRRRGDRYLLLLCLLGLPFFLIVSVLRIRVNKKPYLKITEQEFVLCSLFLRRSVPREAILDAKVMREGGRCGFCLRVKQNDKKVFSSLDWLLLTYNFKKPIKGYSPVIWDIYFHGDANSVVVALMKPSPQPNEV